MTIAPAITFAIENIVIALTPAQRWKAASRQLNTAFMAEPWFIFTAGGALVILTVLLLVVSLRRKGQKQAVVEQLFFDYAERIGLSTRERQLLLEIAGKAGLKRNEDIFTTEIAFDRGAARIMEEARDPSKGEEESEQLRTEISFLCEKLGFSKRQPSSTGSPAKPRNLSSRQIPVGRKVCITRRMARDSGNIEATVVENTDAELTVKSATLVKITFGETWRVRYYFGASIWEFDTTIVGCDGDILVLSHSDTVRFINRRRFLRVPVNKPAFVALFPFTRPLSAGTNGALKMPDAKQGLPNTPGNSWRPPEFVPGVVTELAGPGLRINVPLDVKVGDRVLVVVRLNGENGQNSMPARQDSKSQTSKIVEDIGEVRHTRAEQNGLLIAVELTGLSDSDLNELIRATNLASLGASSNSQPAPAPVSQEQEAAEPAAIQGGQSGG
jgi:hypothetical protein